MFIVINIMIRVIIFFVIVFELDLGLVFFKGICNKKNYFVDFKYMF